MALTAGPAAPAGPGGPGSPRAPWGPSLPRAPWGPVSPWGGRGGRKNRERESALNPRGADSAPGGTAGGHGPGPARRGRPLSRQHRARGAARFFRFGPRGEPTRDSVRPPHHSTRPVPTSFSQLKRRHPGWDLPWHQQHRGSRGDQRGRWDPGWETGHVLGGPHLTGGAGGFRPRWSSRGCHQEELELAPVSPGGSGVTYGGTSSTGSTVITASALQGGRHPLAVPMAAEEPPAPRAGGPSLPNPGTHSRAGGTGTASLTGKTTRTLVGEEDTFLSPRETVYPFGACSHPCAPHPPSPSCSDVSNGWNPCPHPWEHPKDELFLQHIWSPIPFAGRSRTPLTHHLPGGSVLAGAAGLALRERTRLGCCRGAAVALRGQGDTAAPHLGASGTWLTLGTVQTAETLRKRRGVGSQGGTRTEVGLPAPPSLAGGGDSPCDPSCLADQQFRGDPAHPRREAGVTGTLGVCPCSPVPRGADSWCHVLTLPPGRARWGCRRPLLRLPGEGTPAGPSHLGAGGAALSGTAGFSSFTLRRGTLRWWHVPRPGGSCSPRGLPGPPTPKLGGGPYPEATYIISILARGAGGTTGTHGTLGEMQGGVRVLSPVTGLGSAGPAALSRGSQHRDSVAMASAGSRWPCPQPRRVPGWRGDDRTHRSTRFSGFTRGTLETLRTLQASGKKETNKGKNGLEIEKIGPEDPGGSTRTRVPTCFDGHWEGWDVLSCPTRGAACPQKVEGHSPGRQGGRGDHGDQLGPGRTESGDERLPCHPVPIATPSLSPSPLIPCPSCHPIFIHTATPLPPPHHPILVPITTPSLSPSPHHLCPQCHPTPCPHHFQDQFLSSLPPQHRWHGMRSQPLA